MIILLSRDNRVHSLFRSSWEKSLSLQNFKHTSLFSNHGVVNKFLSFLKNYKKIIYSKKIVIFGIQDVLFYKFLFLPNVKKYFVITGFGRLWLNRFSKNCL